MGRRRLAGEHCGGQAARGPAGKLPALHPPYTGLHLSETLSVVTREIGAGRFEEVARRSRIVILANGALRAMTPDLLEALVRRRGVVLTAAATSLTPLGFAAALFSDFFVLERSARIDLDGCRRTSEVIAGVVHRIGRKAVRLWLEAPAALDAQQLLERELADAVVPAHEDSVKWLLGALEGRSLIALESAARLIRMRGGDVGERMEFGRLFAAGEPQRGLKQFLSKEAPEFGEITVETI